MILAIDPGCRGCGCALFEGTTLYRADYVESGFGRGNDVVNALSMANQVRAWIPMWSRYEDRLFIEVPRVYPAARQKGDQNDLIALTLVVGAIVGRFDGKATQYFPRDWKGTLNGDDFIKVIQGKLTPEERPSVTLPAKSLQHNVWDAVGIGLKAVGRLEPKKVYAKEP
jgi:hypothetical protein